MIHFVLIKLVLFCLPLASVFCFAFIDSIPMKFNASMTEQNIRAFYNETIDNQEKTFLNNYSTVYFSNLTSNFPTNSHGTCSATAISMLLTFYDSYWDDDFVDSSFEQNVDFIPNVENSNTVAVPSFSETSPGVKSETLYSVENLSLIQYQDYVVAHQNTYLQSYIIKLAFDLFNNYGFENSTNPYGMDYYEQASLLYYYLVFRRGISTNRAIAYSLYSNDNPDMYDSVVNLITDGIPVILNICSSSIGNHTVVAYDYDATNDEIYVHSGWKDESYFDSALTHVSLTKLNTTSIDSAVIIEATNSFDYSYHYQYETVLRSSCFLSYPQNIVAKNYYYDINPTFKWDSLHREKWFNIYGYNPYIEFNILSHNQALIFTTNIYDGNEFTLPDSTWNYLKNIDPYDDYYVQVKLASSTYSFLNNSCMMAFNKPLNSLGQAITITPTDYTGYTDFYEISDTIRNNFTSHTTVSNFLFKTKRYRAGYIHNECVVISPKRMGYQEAFIEYQFMVPVDRIDIELSHWREITTEGLNPSTGKAVIEVFRYGKYDSIHPVLDLLSTSTNLPEDRNNKATYKLCFDRPITRFRIYAKTNGPNFNENNRGRICIGNIYVYENSSYLNHGDYIDFDTSGSEPNYNPSIWNNDYDIRETNNCYSYALDLQVESHINPGQVGCTYYSRVHDEWNNLSEYLTEYNIVDMVEKDSQPGALFDYGFNFGQIDKDDQILPGAYRIALVFDLCSDHRDYHWYRQNPDGSWSHKPGNGKVRDFDFDGNPIMDPQFCNRMSSAFISEEKNCVYCFNYSSFVNFYSISFISGAE